MWELVSVKTGEVIKEVDAYKLWSDILLTRIETGEPYLMFEDNINRSVPELYKKESLAVQLSNLCVVPETKILTDKGYVEIQEVAGTNQNIWNGFEWSNVLVRQTGTNQEIVKVITSTGDLECTPYHKFYVMDKKRSNKEPILKRASELEVGQTVVFAKYAGSELEFDGVDYVVMKERDILAIVESKPKAQVVAPTKTKAPVKAKPAAKSKAKSKK